MSHERNLSIDETIVANMWLKFLGPHIQGLITQGVLDGLTQHSKNESKKLEPLVFGEVHNVLPKDEQVYNLVGEFDAQKWAKEFKRLFPASDEGTMLGWFANAIMSGYDHGTQQAYAMTTQQKPDAREVPGEREVWLSTYTAAIRQGQTTGAANTANLAVEAFRARYK